jgi:integrase
MLKRDPYNHKARWQKWKQENQAGIKETSKHNSDLILAYLTDMEMGKNVSPKARKGERSCCRLNGLKSRLIFFTKQFEDKDLDGLTKDDIHKLFYAMRNGKIVRKNGQRYVGVGDYVRDFKAFWGWLMRTGGAGEDITVDLRKNDGRKPDWVYLTEEEFKKLANRANSDYRALMWFMYDTGMRVTEAHSIRISDFSNDFTRLNIRQEYAKTFGRIIQLKLCSVLIKEYISFHNLQPEDFLFIKKPAAFNKYLKLLAGNILGDKESPARKPYNMMSLYDIRHNASCYWLKRYPRTTSLMYRMGWSRENEVRYYSEFLGMADQIDDADMVTTEQKTAYERRIQSLEIEREKTNELIKELIAKVTGLQANISLQ